jgi:hypothetical protein
VSAIIAAHLHGQPDDLRQQDGQQHQEIPIAGEERIHDQARTQKIIQRQKAKPADEIDGIPTLPQLTSRKTFGGAVRETYAMRQLNR